jgi:hypothetical protein
MNDEEGRENKVNFIEISTLIFDSAWLFKIMS